MADKPIIFSSEMVRAILDGRKIQTRRIIKPQPIEVKPLGPHGSMWPYKKGEPIPDMPIARVFEPCKPKYQVGDVLWVRESFRYGIIMLGCGGKASVIEYKAGGMQFNKKAYAYAKKKNNKDKKRQHARWRPSIHMFRWAARIFLEVTKVRRAGRVQDITLADIKAEGVSIDPREDWRELFMELWNSTYGDGAWDRNDWIFPYDFKRISNGK